MKNNNLRPTDEILVQLIKQDSLNRNKSLYQFIRLLDNIDDSFSIAVNGEWGTGKTFFIKQAKLIIDINNPQSKIGKEHKELLNKTLPEDIPKIQSQATVYYDAWMYDNHDDPMLSLMYAAIYSNQSDFSLEKEKSLVDIIILLADIITNRNISQAKKEFTRQPLLESLTNEEMVQINVKNFFNELIIEKGNRLVFFIDELDRCKPDYAVKLLERIKHYFDDERITFVFSVNIKQLQNTIKNYYGANFDAIRYLDKFFDLRIQLPDADYEVFLGNRLGFEKKDILDGICIDVIKYYKMSLRECERYIKLIRLSTRMAFNNTSPGFTDDNAIIFATTYFLPVMIALQITDINGYDDFVTGRDSGPLYDIILNANNHFLPEFIKSDSESYDYDTQEIISGPLGEEIRIPVRNRLEEVYNAFFIVQYKPGKREKTIGKILVYSQIQQRVNEIASLLSDYSDYT